MNVIVYFLVILTFKAIEIYGSDCYSITVRVEKEICSGSSNSAFVGDFNGDGKEDFVCHDNKSGDNVVHYAPREVFEPSMSVMLDKWCFGSTSRFFVGDFNGDGRSDFLCHTVDHGYKWIAYADKNGNFTGTGWERDMKWCVDSGEELHVGDFNGDKRTDMLCHNTRFGYKMISYAERKGEFYSTNWRRHFQKCNGKLYTGDFNGDNKTDILCHDRTFRQQISLAGPSKDVFTRIDLAGQQRCNHARSLLRTGDIQLDGPYELMYKDNATTTPFYSKNIGLPSFERITFAGRFCRWSETNNLHLADDTEPVLHLASDTEPVLHLGSDTEPVLYLASDTEPVPHLANDTEPVSHDKKPSTKKSVLFYVTLVFVMFVFVCALCHPSTCKA